MKHESEHVHEIDLLLIALVENEIDPAGMRRLEQLLTNDPESRQQYYRYMSMHASLGWRFGGVQGSVEEGTADAGVLLQIMEDQARLSRECDERDAAWMAQLQQEQAQQQEHLLRLRAQQSGQGEMRRGIVIPRVLVYLGVAACLLIAAIVGVKFFKPHPPSQQIVEQPSEPDHEVEMFAPVVANIHSSIDARWIGLAPGESKLRSETPLTLAEGYVELQLLDGARVLVQAPAVFELTSSNAMRLASGKLVATVPESAVGFVVATANAQITDLGTEFGVYATHDGGYQAHVFQGEITLAPAEGAAGGARGSLFAGDAVDVSSQGRVRTHDADELAFVRSEEYTAIHDSPTSQAARWLAYTYELRRDPALLLHYPFDDQAALGDRVENTAPAMPGWLSARAFDASGAVSPTTGVGRFGEDDLACRFDRSRRDRLVIEDWPQASADLTEMTVAAWVRLDIDTGWHLIASQWDDLAADSDRYAFHFGLRCGPFEASQQSAGDPVETGRPGLQAHRSRDGSTFDYDVLHEGRSGSATTSGDGWVHVALVLKADGWMLLYRNGIEVDRQRYSDSSPLLPQVSSPLVFGNKANAIESDPLVGLDGWLDDIVLMSRALDKDEVLAMYAAGTAEGLPR